MCLNKCVEVLKLRSHLMHLRINYGFLADFHIARTKLPNMIKMVIEGCVKEHTGTGFR